MSDRASQPRDYTVGLPVSVTIAADGEVTWEVDFSELASAISETEDDTNFVDEVRTEAEINADALAAAQWWDRHCDGLDHPFVASDDDPTLCGASSTLVEGTVMLVCARQAGAHRLPGRAL